MDAKLNIGLIGFGLAGGVLHAPVIAAVPRLRVAAAVTSRADAVASAFPDAVVYDHVDRLLGDPGIDLVVVATPNEQHAPLARAALTAGKHVVVDKPFVTDPADGRALIELARERGRVLSVFHNRRWDGDFLAAAGLMASGRLGEVKLAHLCWDRHRAAIKQGWREQPGEGSGLLADLGPHLVDQALQLFGRPDAVMGDILVQRAAAAVDDYFELTLHYDSARVVLAASTLVAAPRPRFALHGTGASYASRDLDPQEAALRAGDYGAPLPAHEGVLTLPDGTTERVTIAPGDWRGFYEGVAAAILDGAPAPVDPADALAGLELIELARRSAREGRVMPFPR